ncbi:MULTISPECIES: hypothetical protein [unclassified Micromonospora]|uniref:hypothetical protein n=1 Tax=unclassified Micromonospora TaxID=2617518 RepID=UPI00331C1737
MTTAIATRPTEQTAVILPTLTAADVTVTTDHMGREVIVIPDVFARLMRDITRDGWREFPGVADGESRKFPAGGWMFRTTATIVAAYAASPIPAGATGHDADRYRQSRQYAEHGCGYAFIVGAAGWDADARWWRDYPLTKGLHVHASPHLIDKGRAYRFSG